MNTKQDLFEHLTATRNYKVIHCHLAVDHSNAIATVDTQVGIYLDTGMTGLNPGMSKVYE